jgi:cytochrome c biogenesis protein CcmG/thiol:disulfide interchange protein DsbE
VIRLRWLVLAGALTALGCAPRALPPSAPSELLGAPVPDFTLQALDGERIDTESLRGSTVVFKFFAEHCEPCKRTLPAAERLHLKKPDVAFVGVSADDYAASARAVGRAYGLSFPIVHDAGRALQSRFGVTKIPITFVVDGTGLVRWVGGPAQTARDLESALDVLRSEG